jgi:RNA polymerase sigma factor (sigma-70 family)
VHELAVDDFELLRRWTGGDAVAGDLLARRYYPNVRRFFDVKVPAHAEDLTQRTFLACAESLAGFRGDATFKAYLFGIARFQLLRHLRHTKVREDHAAKKSWSSGSSGSGWSGTSARHTSLSMIVANRQEHHLLLLAYAKLPPDQQIAIELYYWEDMTSSEIGAALDVPTSTVTTRLSRARAALCKAVEDLTSPGAVRDSLVADLDRWTRSLCSR